VPPGEIVPPVESEPPGDGLPAGDTVDLWWFDTRAVTVSAAGLASLDAGERDRAQAFLFPADRHRYQVAHVLLRRVLAGYTGAAPGRLRLGRQACSRCGGPSGKPVLLPGSGPSSADPVPPPTGPGPSGGCAVPSFSLTHSGDTVVIAVAGRAVGVDVERDAAGCVCSLAGTLHPADATQMAGLDERERHEAIMTCWVRAEAVLKCAGQGIGHGLGGFPVQPGHAGDLGVYGCTVRHLLAPPGYRAAVALAGTCALTLRARPGSRR
jgi:4'-phosphopantetheinyl transferase